MPKEKRGKGKNRTVEAKKADKTKETRETLDLSARMAVATGLSYGRQVLLTKQQKKDLRAFLEGMK